MRIQIRRSLIVFGCVGTLGVACRKPSAADHRNRGIVQFDQGHYPEAIVEFRGALQTDPSLGEVRLKLGDAYLQVQDPRNALREYVRAADLLPSNVGAQVKAGSMLLLARKFEDARSRADRAIALDAKNVDAQVLRGNALAGLKDFDAAMAEYQEAIALDPSQSLAYTNLGTLQLGQGKRAEAEATFRKAVEAAPASLSAHLALANFFWSTGDQKRAEASLQDALRIDAKNIAANRALGLFYMATGRVAEAGPYFAAIAKFAHTDDASLSLADYYIVAKRAEDARKLLRELAARDEAYPAATVRLAALDAAEGQSVQAQDRLRQLLQKHPKDAQALLLSARIYLADNKREEARQATRAVIANDPNAPGAARAYLLLGQIESASDRIDDAIAAYEQVLKLQPQPLAADLELAKLYLRKGNPGKAVTYAQQALVLQRTNPQAQNLLIRAEIANGDFEKARTDLAPLSQAWPNAVPVLKLAALVQVASKQPDAARASYLRVLEMVANDFEALTGLVQIEMSTGRAKEAAARVDEWLARATPSASLLALAAQAHAATGDLTRVEALLRKSIETDPDRLQAYTMLGQLYVRQNRLEEAKAQYRDVLKRNPKSVSAGTIIGMVLEQQGQPLEAEKEYARVLSIDPNAVVAANNLAWLFVSSNRKLDEAFQLAQTALQHSPDEPNVNDTLAWIYYRKNMAASAIPYLESSIRASPSDPTFRFHLGMVLVQTGDWTRARQELQRALDLNPTFEGAAEAKKALAMMGA